MRLAIVTDSFYPELGGIQDSVLAASRALAARGHAVLILAPAAAERDFARAGLAAAEVDAGPGVRVRRVFALPAPGSTGQSRVAVPGGAVRRALAEFGPDVTHVHTFLGAGLAARAAVRRLGLPAVATNHWSVAGFGHYAPFARAQMVALACRSVARFYNGFALTSVPSRATLAEMRAHGFTGAAEVVSNPIDTATFRPAAPEARAALRQEWGLDGPAVVYAGRLAVEKRVEVLLRAMPGVDATLVLAGHGTARPALEQLARELGVAHRVRFTGMLDHARLAGLFQAADAFAIASTSESQGMALLQAMACGLPAAGVAHGPLAEYIPAAAGALARPEAPESMAACLRTVLDRRAAMAPEAAAWAGGFGTGPVVERWEAIYAVAAGERRMAA